MSIPGLILKDSFQVCLGFLHHRSMFPVGEAQRGAYRVVTHKPVKPGLRMAQHHHLPHSFGADHHIELLSLDPDGENGRLSISHGAPEGLTKEAQREY